ncbi:hypothetical protein OAJ29_01095 [Euryarchaeota archaeon]|nr:hypothetical protein [Euryarchaeota archaeon]
MEIQWVTVEPGEVFIGSDNRSVLFGGIGPRHEIKTNYSFEISFFPVNYEIAELALQNEDCFVASESEWSLAMDKKLISGENEVEELSDRIRGSYWSKYCDGRPFIEENWLMKVSRSWSNGTPSITSIPKGEGCKYLRLVKRTKVWGHDSSAPKLPESSDKSNLLFEELLISLIIGIIPSFIWAYFNASTGYISEGWLNLVFGGLFIGVFTVIFWRPRTKSWRVGKNCNKMKII